LEHRPEHQMRLTDAKAFWCQDAQLSTLTLTDVSQRRHFVPSAQTELPGSKISLGGFSAENEGSVSRNY